MLWEVVHQAGEIVLIQPLVAASGRAILVISSELPELIGLADRILVMAEGRIVGELSREKASEERILKLAMAENLGPIDEARID